MPPASTVAATSGTAASSITTLVSTPTEVPLTRNRVKGRFRSTRPPPTVTARLHPATIRVSATAAYTIFSARLARAVLICSVSPQGRGGGGDDPYPAPGCGAG